MFLRVCLSRLGIHSISLLAIILLNLPSTLLAQSQKTRGNFVEIPLIAFNQPLLSGDPNQLPLIALHDYFSKDKYIPSVIFDRSNPKRIVAIISQPKSAKKTSYRVEMVPTDSLCDCQRWKVVWIGQQN